MCGGWRWSNHDWKPTPRPGDFVKVKVCKVCRKRARAPKLLIEKKYTMDPRIRLGMRDEGAECATNVSRWGKTTVTVDRQTELGTCCHKTRNHIEVMGRVERTVWSRNKHKSPSKFFFIVYIPIFDKRVWVNLEAHIELVAAHEFLINNVPEDEV